MKHQELVDHIQGSYLKRQYLEAFLVQSAYIENLIKLYFDLNYFSATGHGGEKITEQDDKHKALLKAISEHFDRTNLVEVVRLLKKSGLISDEQSKLIEQYRIKRNKVFHELVFEMSEASFENDLKTVCDIGSKIIQTDEFARMAKLVQFLEEKYETSRNQASAKNHSAPEEKPASTEPETPLSSVANSK